MFLYAVTPQYTVIMMIVSVQLLADNVTRTASVVALEWSDLVYITKSDFQGLISSFPREQFKIYKYGESKIKNWKVCLHFDP